MSSVTCLEVLPFVIGRHFLLLPVIIVIAISLLSTFLYLDIMFSIYLA